MLSLLLTKSYELCLVSWQDVLFRIPLSEIKNIDIKEEVDIWQIPGSVTTKTTYWGNGWSRDLGYNNPSSYQTSGQPGPSNGYQYNYGFDTHFGYSTSNTTIIPPKTMSISTYYLIIEFLYRGISLEKAVFYYSTELEAAYSDKAVLKKYLVEAKEREHLVKVKSISENILLDSSEHNEETDARAELMIRSKSIRDGQVLVNDDFPRLNAEPEEFEDYRVDIVGKIYATPEYDGKQLIFEMLADPIHGSGNVLVCYPGKLSLVKGDIVRVKGTVVIPREENLQRCKLTKFWILASSIKRANITDALTTPEYIAVVEQSEEINGLTITLHSVELALEGTRVIISIKNESNKAKSIYYSSCVLVQGSKQYETVNIYENGIPSNIYPGVTVKGLLLFPCIDWTAGSCKIYISGLFVDFIFDVYWQP